LQGVARTCSPDFACRFSPAASSNKENSSLGGDDGSRNQKCRSRDEYAKLWDARWLFCFSLPLSFGRILHAAAGSTVADSTVADSTMADSTVADSMMADSIPDSPDSTVTDFTPPFANFMGSTTAVLAHSTTDDFITTASAAALWCSLPSAPGGGAADGVGPIITPTAAITDTGPTQATGITARIRPATTPM
jgi:hypothetical protein